MVEITKREEGEKKVMFRIYCRERKGEGEKKKTSGIYCGKGREKKERSGIYCGGGGRGKRGKEVTREGVEVIVGKVI